MGEDRVGRKIGEVAARYGAWLEKQPLSENTKRAYRTRAGQFLEWLAATPDGYDALTDGHARDYAARDFMAHLNTVRKAKPSSVNLSLAAIDSPHRQFGMGRPDAKREDLPTWGLSIPPAQGAFAPLALGRVRKLGRRIVPLQPTLRWQRALLSDGKPPHAGV